MNNPNIRLFYGPNQFLLRRELERWKKGFLEKHGDTNLDVLDGKIVSGSDIINAADTAPFLGEKRLIIVTDFLPEPKGKSPQESGENPQETAKDDKKEISDSIDALIDYFPRISESSILLFVNTSPDKRSRLFKALEKQGTVSFFDEYKGAEFGSWVSSELKKSGITLDSGVRDQFLSLMGEDMWKASQEIEKLSLLGIQKLSVEDINMIISSNAQANIFAFVDAVGKKNLADSIRLFHRLLDSGEHIFVVLSMVVRQFRLLLMTKYLLSQKEDHRTILGRLRLAPFQLPPLIKQSENFSMSLLKDIFQQLLEIDIDFKTGKIPVHGENPALASMRLEQFFAKSSFN